jgi:hypothetical protein
MWFSNGRKFGQARLLYKITYYNLVYIYNGLGYWNHLKTGHFVQVSNGLPFSFFHWKTGCQFFRFLVVPVFKNLVVFKLFQDWYLGFVTFGRPRIGSAITEIISKAKWSLVTCWFLIEKDLNSDHQLKIH